MLGSRWGRGGLEADECLELVPLGLLPARRDPEGREEVIDLVNMMGFATRGSRGVWGGLTGDRGIG